MNLQQMKYILVLAEERSFSGAAARLYITQPSLSRFIIALEKELGARLFDRSTLPITLTPAGEIVCASYRQIMDTEENMTRQLSALQESPQAQISFGTIPMRARYLANSIAVFCRENPSIKVHIYENYMRDLKNRLRDGELEFLISAGPLTGCDFDFEILKYEQVFFVAPPSLGIGVKSDPRLVRYEDLWDGAVLEKPCVDLAEFIDHPVIDYTSHTKIHKSMLLAYKNQGLTPNISQTIRSYDIAMSMIREGNGVSFFCTTALKLTPFADDVRCYRVDVPEWPICVFSRKNCPLSPTAWEFIHYLKDNNGPHFSSNDI